MDSESRRMSGSVEERAAQESGTAAQMAAIADARMALRRQEAGLRLALEAGKMGTFEWNIQTGEIGWSPNLEAIHGLPAGTFSGTFESFEALIHPDDRAEVLANIRRCVETGADYEAEFRSATLDANPHWILGKGKVLARRPGRTVAHGGRLHGHHPAQARRGGDLRTPTVARTSSWRWSRTSCATRWPRSPTPQRCSTTSRRPNPIASKACGMIRRQTEQLSRIVNDLLDISRLTAGKLILNGRRLDLGGPGRKMRCTRSPAPPARPASLGATAGVTGAGQRRRPAARADRHQSGDQRREVHAPGGTVTVEVEPIGGEAVLRVRDTGVGIAANLLPRVFDRFVQSERGARSPRGRASGSGSRSSRQLVEAHGGRIEAHSDGPDQGTEFVVRLPLASRSAVTPERGRDRAARRRRRASWWSTTTRMRARRWSAAGTRGHEVHAGRGRSERAAVGVARCSPTSRSSTSGCR